MGKFKEQFGLSDGQLKQTWAVPKSKLIFPGFLATKHLQP